MFGELLSSAFVPTQMLSAVSGLLIAVLMVVADKGTPHTYQDVIWIETQWAFQLGGFVFGLEKKVPHEYGHYLQERILKQHYLLIVGGGSVLANFFQMQGCLPNYRSFPTEAWADELHANFITSQN